MVHGGFLLLEGGAEFGGAMAEPDRQGLALAGGLTEPVALLPTAAAPDDNHEQAGANALQWFRALGASNLDLVGIIDRASAEDEALAARVGRARLIYMLGGFPRYLAETLRGSRAWNAALRAYTDGAVLAGSSAGAMVLCEHYYDPHSERALPGLNLLPACCVLPHHNTFGGGWAAALREQLPAATLLGIDERTGMLRAAADRWAVYGAGEVTLYHAGQVRTFARGESFTLAADGPHP
jgi:cyanophycinase